MGTLVRLVRLVRRHQFDVSLVSLLLVLHVFGFGQAPDVGLAASALAAVPIVSLLFRRVAPLFVAVAYLVTTAVSLLVGLPDPSSASTVVVIVAGAYSAGAYLSLRAGLATLALWCSASLLYSLSQVHGVSDLFFGWLILACGFVPGVVAQRLRRQAEAGQAAMAAATRELEQAEEAVTAERAQIARELHDVVAHALSIMVVQAAAADELLDRDPARAHAALRAVQEAGRSAVTEMARMLDVLRGTTTGDDLEPLPTLSGLDALVKQARLAGADVDLALSPPLPTMPPAIELCAVRVVQEALTNAATHACNPRVRVAVASVDGVLDVVVEDDGGSGPRAGAGTGHGLMGLRERVEVFHGTIDAAPRPGGGFRLKVGLPIGGPP